MWSETNFEILLIPTVEITLVNDEMARTSTLKHVISQIKELQKELGGTCQLKIKASVLVREGE